MGAPRENRGLQESAPTPGEVGRAPRTELIEFVLEEGAPLREKMAELAQFGSELFRRCRSRPARVEQALREGRQSRRAIRVALLAGADELVLAHFVARSLIRMSSLCLLLS